MEDAHTIYLISTLFCDERIQVNYKKKNTQHHINSIKQKKKQNEITYSKNNILNVWLYFLQFNEWVCNLL